MVNPNITGELHESALQWLQAHPAATNLLAPWLMFTGVAFTAGLLTRTTYALFVAGALVWAAGAVAFDNTHPYSPLLLTLVALLPSRWGDAWSVDARLGRTSRSDSSRIYGYTVWVPGLAFGVAFAAAAWAKLSPHGLAWITNGSIKYHFVSDAANAKVDWGLQFAAHPMLAVLGSLAAVAIEALVITAAFTKSGRYRLLMGVAALAMLGGFYLFMGLFWPAWWILLLGFLPWTALRFDAALPRAAAPHVTFAQLTLMLFVIGQQVVASALTIERAPMFSSYPMYSETYASPEAFEAAARPMHRMVVSTDNGPVELSCNAPGELVADFQTALKGSVEASASVRRAVSACRPDLAEARQVSFYEERRTFDWQRLTFTERQPVVLGTLDLP
jgi:hypothetical protein